MKRGISTLVATVLIILITVAAVAIIWVAVVPMVNENIEFGELDGRVSVLSSGGYTVYDADEEVAIVQVKRDVDEGVMNRVKIIFIIGGNSYSSTVVAPGSGQTKTYSFDLSDYGEPESVSVAPIFVSSSGKEKKGSVTSRADFVLGEIDNVDADVYDLERDYFYEMPMTGLVSWWRFDGDVNDSVGENDGELVGGNLDGGVLNLDGDGDWVEVGLPASLEEISTSSFTFSAWIRITDEGRGNIFGNYDYTGFPSINFEIQDSNAIRYYHSDGSMTDSFEGSSNVVGGLWHHVIMIRDKSDNLARLYVDKIIENQISITTNNNVVINEFFIGRDHRFEMFYNGSIDNVMIFDRALTQEEIIAIYENQKK